MNNINTEIIDFQSIKSHLANQLYGTDFYEKLSDLGGLYGASFQCIEKIWFSEREILAKITNKASANENYSYKFSPVVLDNIFLSLTATGMTPAQLNSNYFIGPPAGLGKVNIVKRPGASIWVHGRRKDDAKLNEKHIVGDVKIYNEEGYLIAESYDVKFHKFARNTLNQHIKNGENFYTLAWEKINFLPKVNGAINLSEFLIFTNSNEFANYLNLLAVPSVFSCLEDVLSEGSNKFSTLESAKIYFRDKFVSSLTKKKGIIFLANDNKFAEAEYVNQLCTTFIALIQACLSLNDIENKSFIIITHGGQLLPTDNNLDIPFSSTLWGVAKSVANELRGFDFTLIDLDPIFKPKESMTHILSCLGQVELPKQLIIRDDGYWSPVVKKDISIADERPISFSDTGCYLLLGGTGAIGREIAKFLAVNGAKNIVLVARKVHDMSFEEDYLFLYKELASFGTKLYRISADVINSSQMERLYEEVKIKELLPVKGIFFLVGIISDAAIFNMTSAKLKDVLFPKVAGVINTFSLIKKYSIELDFMVLFSSIASIIGTPGQSNYAGANMFLDEFSIYLNSLKIPTHIINWGPWTLGMSNENKISSDLQRKGVNFLTKQQSINQLARILSASKFEQKIVVNFDQKFIESLTNISKEPFKNITNLDEAVIDTRYVSALSALKNLSEQEKRLSIQKELIETIAKIGQFEISQVSLDEDLVNLGLDSLMVLEIKAYIENKYCIRLPMSLLLEEGNIISLTESLLKHSSSILNLQEDKEEFVI